MEPGKKSNSLIIVLVILIAIIAIGFLATKDNSPSENNAQQINEAKNQPELNSTTNSETNNTANNDSKDPATPTENSNSETADNDPAMNENDNAEESSSNSSTAGTYQDYDASAVASSNAENIILFFHATWCPSCHALNASITSNQDSIPAGTEIYKVDYDTSLELRKRYSVTTQHTLVMIDKNGNLLKKWDNSMTLDALVKKI